ncbi:copper transpport protein [Pseudogymnoascus australis]
MDHGDHDASPARCNMNMLFTWSTQDLCIIFRSWHITGPITLTLSLFAIVALVAAFEALRATTARYDALVLKRREELPREEPAETTTLLPGQQAATSREVRRAQVARSALYAVQTFYAFMIM